LPTAQENTEWIETRGDAPGMESCERLFAMVGFCPITGSGKKSGAMNGRELTPSKVEAFGCLLLDLGAKL